MVRLRTVNVSLLVEHGVNVELALVRPLSVTSESPVNHVTVNEAFIVTNSICLLF